MNAVGGITPPDKFKQALAPAHARAFVATKLQPGSLN
jgi:hypothetical protein